MDEGAAAADAALTRYGTGGGEELFLGVSVERSERSRVCDEDGLADLTNLERNPGAIWND